MRRLLPAVAALALIAALAQAQTGPPPIPSGADGATAATAAKAAAPAADDCGQCGRVISIRQTMVKQQWTPLGTATGFTGDAQAVTQFRIGKGGVNEGPVLVGPAGGAVYQRSPNSYEKPRWDVTVKLDSGQTRVVQLAYEPYIQEGDRVRISGRNVELAE